MTFTFAALTGSDWLVLGAAALTLAFCLGPLIWLSWLFVTSSYSFEETVADVQRFVDLTDAARRELAATPPLTRSLLDRDAGGATTAAIDRFISLQEGAHEALWGRDVGNGSRAQGGASVERRGRTGDRVLRADVDERPPGGRRGSPDCHCQASSLA